MAINVQRKPRSGKRLKNPISYASILPNVFNYCKKVQRRKHPCTFHLKFLNPPEHLLSIQTRAVLRRSARQIAMSHDTSVGE